MLVVRPREAWLRQAREAMEAFTAAAPTHGGHITLLEFADADYQQFCLLVEAMHALGQRFSADVMERAQMRPVGELFS